MPRPIDASPTSSRAQRALWIFGVASGLLSSTFGTRTTPRWPSGNCQGRRVFLTLEHPKPGFVVVHWIFEKTHMESIWKRGISQKRRGDAGYLPNPRSSRWPSRFRWWKKPYRENVGKADDHLDSPHSVHLAPFYISLRILYLVFHLLAG